MQMTVIAKSAPHKAEADGATWQFLPHVLGLAFLLRAAFALTTNYVTYSDEIFQYLEQAHRLVFGHGIVPWEYVYGVRSWIIPGFIALILKSLAAFGLDRPDVYQPTVRLIFCAISVSLPLSVYRITQGVLSEGAARGALGATAFWPLLVYFSPTPLPDALGGYAVFGALAWLFGRPARGSAIIFGSLAGLTLALRFQLAPMVGTAMLIAAARWRWRGWPALVGFTFVIGMAGALDAYTWGRWFSSVVTNVELNLFADVAEVFGTAPEYSYLRDLATYSGGLAYLGAAGLALSWSKTWPLAVLGLVQFAAFSAVGHKEMRFLLPLVPIYLIGLAAFFASDGQRLRGPISGVVMRVSFAFCIVVVFAGATFVLGLGIMIGHSDVRQAYVSVSRRLDERQAYRMLSRRSDVQGVIDDSGVTWNNTGGYYDLHQSAPIYRADLPGTELARVRRSPQLFASYWLTSAEVAAPEGYELLARVGTIAIWHRSKDPPETLIPPGYSTHVPIPFNDEAISPKVTPRW
jgi:phosphatidylinositol glycan class B